jgi:hypothetical protein
MDVSTNADLSGSARKAKLLVLFCALGGTLFVFNLGAGVWLWKYVAGYSNILPAYDRFLADVRQANPQSLVDIAMTAHAGWEACEQARVGIQETIVHITLAASFIGLVLFTVCFVLGSLLHRDLLGLPGGLPDPLPPDDVDGTWR